MRNNKKQISYYLDFYDDDDDDDKDDYNSFNKNILQIIYTIRLIYDQNVFRRIPNMNTT